MGSKVAKTANIFSTALAGRIPLSANFLRLWRLPGFHGFIATEAEVPSVFASRYGMTFLRHLSREGNPWEILSTRCVEKGACFRLICSIHALRIVIFVSPMAA